MNCTENLAEDMEKIIKNSPMAAAVIGRNGAVLYRNPACEKLCPAIDFSDVEEGFSGEIYALCENKNYKLSVSYVSDGISLVNITPAGFDESMFIGVDATLRKTAACIIEGLNNLACSISPDDELARRMLDMIEGNVLTICSELLVPEAIAEIRVPENAVGVVSISNIFDDFMHSLSYLAKSKYLQIRGLNRIKSGLTSRMSERALRLLLLEFVASCFDGEYNINSISPMLTRTERGTVLLELSCGFLGNDSNVVLDSRAASRKNGYDPAGLLACEIRKKYGCIIKYKKSEAIRTFSVEMEYAESELSENGFKSKGSFFYKTGKFSDISEYLARYEMNHFFEDKFTNAHEDKDLDESEDFDDFDFDDDME